LFQQVEVVAVRVRHENLRRRIVAVYEKADLAVDREVERTSNAVHAPGAQPILGRSEQRRRDIRVILAFKEAEESGLLAVVAVVLVVDLG